MTALIRSELKSEGSSFENSLFNWADKTTALESNRAEDIQRDKIKAVKDFFEFCPKSIDLVTAKDVSRWREHLAEAAQLRPGTIYNRLCYLSSFYDYLRSDSRLAQYLLVNPARASLPKAPKPYSSENIKDLTDAELNALWKTIERHARKSDDPMYQRDWAIFRLFIATGMRRSEIINLNGNAVELTDEGLLIRARVKGNKYDRREVEDVEAKNELIRYLKKTQRLDVIGTKRPLWIRHDRGVGKKEIKLTTHAFAVRMKEYAGECQIENFHLHRLRHTFARIISEEAGSIFETQEGLGHSNPKTTEHYVRRLKVRKDKYSSKIRDRIKPN